MYKLLIVVLCITTSAFANHHERHFKGLKRDKKKLSEFKKKAKKKHVLRAGPIPGTTDLTLLVSPPEDQGQCGSCWSFSITKALRSAMMLAGNDPGTLSFNYLLDNCGGVVNESGCNGGDFPAGQNMLNKLGPWLGAHDPYTASTGKCLHLPTVATAVDWIVVGDGNSPPTFEQLAAAISERHMLSVDVAVCGAWENYPGGIFSQSDCGADSINHMINMVSYNCQTSVDSNGNCVFNRAGQPKNGDGYLIVQNNWGSSWGEGGYMRTRWGVDAIADTAMYFDVSNPSPNPTLVPSSTPIPVPTPTPTPVPSRHGFLCKWFQWLPWCH